MSERKPLVRVGTCGFRLTRGEYAQLLHAVEIQQTFYQPPQLQTLARWRAEAPAGFEFTVKAWQLITHQSSSPTYRRLKRKLTETEREKAGFFRPTEIVREAWEVTRACAAALKARVILFQCPASFTQTARNIAQLESFFSSIERGRLRFAWEPRGEWSQEVIRGLCRSLDLWHVVDPFAARTVTPTHCYFRLHGRKGWRYRYEDEELEELATMLPARRISYVFFNNIGMTEDAQRFQETLQAVHSRGAEKSQRDTEDVD
ncbi:MAG: DUF72 domain-containing protein [Acidobacteria bacterium]|nr:DUF72 domain-containing protein [Acidobacteriota bacterium]